MCFNAPVAVAALRAFPDLGRFRGDYYQPEKQLPPITEITEDVTCLTYTHCIPPNLARGSAIFGNFSFSGFFLNWERYNGRVKHCTIHTDYVAGQGPVDKLSRLCDWAATLLQVDPTL